MTRIRWILAVLILLFGVLSAHYVIGEGIEHHREWAVRHGMPEPSFAIFVLGMAATVFASAMMGWMLARRR